MGHRIIFLSPIDEISRMVKCKPELLPAYVMNHIDDILYTKFKADGVIKYDYALSLSQTAIDGYNFLDFLLPI